MPFLPAEELRRLGANRWAVPVMAFLDREGGARFAVLARQLGVPQNSLSRCLAHLRECGWVVPNPGHGHPLRPDYVLSAPGRPVAALCGRIMAVRERLSLGPHDLPRWGLPLVAELAPDLTRFNTLQAQLAPITPRALSQTLQAMIGTQIVRRRVEDGSPPYALYGLTERGHTLASALAP